jgi:hypothetical protein
VGEKNCPKRCEAIENKQSNVKLPDCDNNWAIREPAALKTVAQFAGF